MLKGDLKVVSWVITEDYSVFNCFALLSHHRIQSCFDITPWLTEQMLLLFLFGWTCQKHPNTCADSLIRPESFPSCSFLTCRWNQAAFFSNLHKKYELINLHEGLWHQFEPSGVISQNLKKKQPLFTPFLVSVIFSHTGKRFVSENSSVRRRALGNDIRRGPFRKWKLYLGSWWRTHLWEHSV